MDGREAKRFMDALLDAFDEKGLQKLLRFELGVRLDRIAGPGNFEDTVFAVIQWAERESRTDELIRAAASAQPGNLALSSFDEESGEPGETSRVQIFRDTTATRLDYRQEISGILDFSDRRFAGREAEIERVFAYAAGSAEPSSYLLVEAGAGFGKSAFMAQLILRAESRNWPDPKPRMVYFLIRSQGSRNTPLAFLHAVNSQLLDRLNLEGGTPASLSAARDHFTQLWRRAEAAATAEAPLLLLIDGLDEQSRPTETALPADERITVSDLFPWPRSPHARVIVSTRPNPPPREQVAREHPLRIAKALLLPRFDLDGVHKVLRQLRLEASGQPLPPIDSSPGVSERILALTTGEPLFVRLVTEEFAAGGEAALERLESNPPRDAEDYFQDQIHALVDQAKSDLVWRLLGFLMEARAGLTAEELSELAQRPLREVTSGLRSVERYLIGRIGASSLELMHARLRERLAGEFGKLEVEETRRRLMDWCEDYRKRGWPDETPDYVLTEYAGHLAKDSRKDALFELYDQKLLRLHRRRFRKLEHFISDLELVAGTARASNPAALVPLAKSGYAEASIRSLATSIPPAAIRVLARIGDLDQAIDYATLSPRLAGCEALSGVSVAALERGERARAASLLSEALDRLGSVDFLIDEDVSVIRRVAEAAIAAREADGIERLHRFLAGLEVDTAVHLAPVLEATAVLVSKDRAVALARQSLPRGPTCAAMAAKLGVSLGEPDLIREAHESVEAKPWDLQALPSLAAIANAWAASGEAERARKLWHRLQEHAIQAFLEGRQWCSLARELSHPSMEAHYRRARDEAFESLPTTSSFLEYLAEDLADLSFEREDDSLTERVVDWMDSSWRGNGREEGQPESYLMALARGYARRGHPERAFRAARAVEREGSDWSYERSTWQSVVAGLAQRGLFADAREAARALEEFGGTVEAFSMLAEELGKAGRDDEALELVREAMRAAEGELRNPAVTRLGRFAEALAGVGSLERASVLADSALTSLDAIPAGQLTAADFMPVMKALLAVGRHEEVVRRCRAFWGETGACDLLARVAAKEGDTDLSREAAEAALARVPAGEFGEIVCLVLAARAFANTDPGRAKELLDRARLMAPEEDFFRLGRTAEIVCAYASLGEATEAGELLRKLEDHAGVAAVLREDDPDRPRPEEEDEDEEEGGTGGERFTVAAAFLALGREKEATALSRRGLEEMAGSDIVSYMEESLEAAIALLLRRGEERCVRETLASWTLPEKLSLRSALAVAIHRAGREEWARGLLADLFFDMRTGSKFQVEETLSTTAPILAAIDCGETLWQVHAALENVDSWWSLTGD